MRLYLSGPMRGYSDSNYPAFFKTANLLRLIYGVTVHNPAEQDLWDHDSPIIAQAHDLSQVLFWAEGVFVLDGWERSKGARAEVFTALWRELPIYDRVDIEGNLVEANTGRIRVEI